MRVVKMYRKKPVEVQALQYTRENFRQILEFTEMRYFTLNVDTRVASVYDKLHDTWVKVVEGDWIIRGLKGEFYPCANDVFVNSYEEVLNV